MDQALSTLYVLNISSSFSLRSARYDRQIKTERKKGGYESVVYSPDSIISESDLSRQRLKNNLTVNLLLSIFIYLIIFWLAVRWGFQPLFGNQHISVIGETRKANILVICSIMEISACPIKHCRHKARLDADNTEKTQCVCQWT